MTIIVYRDGVLAADSGAFRAGTKRAYNNKIARGPDGTLYGVTGNADNGTAYLTWVREGCVGEAPLIRRLDEKESDSAIEVLRVRPGHDPECITGYGFYVWECAPYAVCGAAHEVAFGALHAGATAVQAVEACIAHSQWALGPVRLVKHNAE